MKLGGRFKDSSFVLAVCAIGVAFYFGDAKQLGCVLLLFWAHNLALH